MPIIRESAFKGRRFIHHTSGDTLMHQRFPHIPLTACALAAGLLVSACGGGEATAPGSTTPTSGFAVDGYLSGATVFCDANGNGSADTGEVSTTTDSSGFFKLSGVCESPLVAIGGTSIDTGLAFTGKLKAPAGAKVLTPLTTLLAEGMTDTQVKTALGLSASTDLLSTDPALMKDGALVNADLYKKGLALHQLAQQTTEVFAKLASTGGDAARPAIYSEVLAAMASALKTSTPLNVGSTLDQTVVAALVKSAAQKVGASTLLSTEIKTGAQSVNADSLAAVVAGSLKAQGDTLLQASATTLTAATTTAQSDTNIASFVSTSKASMAGAPGTGTDGLSTSLKDMVVAHLSGTVTPPPPPPANSGTVLVSFDEANAAFTGMGAYGGALPDVVAGPTGGSGNALKILKPTSPDAWGGVYFGVANIPFTADRQKITARVNATKAGAIIKFKVESSNGGPAVEVASTPTGAANTWQTVTWDMTGVDIAKAYGTIAITPDQDLVTSGQAYYIDDITLAAAATATPSPAPSPTPSPAPASCGTTDTNCVNFSESSVGFLGFEGLISATVADDPVAGASNKVGKLVKGPSGQPWAGATLYTAGTVNPDPAVHSVLSVAPFGLTANKVVTVRSYTSAAVGTRVTLKLENSVDQGVNIAAETTTTTQNAWETLTFNFANLTTGVFSPTATYNAAVIFPAFSIPGNAGPFPSADTAFYFDDLTYAKATAAAPTPSPSPAPAPSSAPLVFASNYSEAPTPWKSVEGGDAGRYAADGALDW
jgi:hypothetical protein